MSVTYLCPYGEELEDGEHAPGRSIVAIQKAQGVADGIPHALDGSPRAALGDEPIREGDVVQVTDVLQSAVQQVRVNIKYMLYVNKLFVPIKVEERADYRRCCERHRVGELVGQLQLLCSGSQTVERGADPTKPEVLEGRKN